MRLTDGGRAAVALSLLIGGGVVSAQSARGLRPTGEPLRPQEKSSEDPLLLADESEYGMLLDADERVVNLILPPDHYLRLSQTERPGTADARVLSRIVHDRFLDVFDFLIIAFDERQPWVGNDTTSGLHHRVRVDAEGLGLGARLQVSGYGTDGPLSSVVFLETPEELRTGLALHEIMHRWGQAVLPTDRPRHWGWSSVNGILGGWAPGHLKRRRNGVYVPRGNRREWRPTRFDEAGEIKRPYADLELYLLGLIPPDSVGDTEVAVGARPNPGRGSAFTAERMETYPIERIIAEHGERVPSWKEAQHEFRGIVVIVSMLPIGRRAMSKWSAAVRDLGTPGPDKQPGWLNFWEATGGRATLRLDSLGSALRYDPTTGEEIHCSEAAKRDSLLALQARVLAAVPREVDFRQRGPPTSRLGYGTVHGYAVLRKLGMALVNSRAVRPLPQLLFYMPDDTAADRDWTAFRVPVGTYHLAGWGYQLTYAEGGAPPRRACIPREAWFVQEAGWHLRNGGMELTPGVVDRPAPGPGRDDLFYWHRRSYNLHFWIEENGVPRVSLENDRAPDRGVELPSGAYVPWSSGDARHPR